MAGLRRGLAVGLAALLVAGFAAVALGSDDASLSRALAAPGLDRTIILNLRLPRVLLTLLAGGGLAVVGAAFQALLRNPLAEPYVLGVSGGAAVGATTVIALGVSAAGWLGALLIPGAALVGGVGSTALVYWIARRAPQGPSGASILLAGVMVNAIAAALITFGKLVVPPSRAQRMLRWLVGFIELPSALALMVTAICVLAGAILLWRDGARLNALALGDESAATLGVDVGRLERRVFVIASCVVGAIVSLTGLIGFVGLVVPHAVRRLFGPDHRRLLPIAFLFGATGLVLCDLGTRLALRAFDNQVPVGAVTALIGGPAFLWMLAQGRRAQKSW